MSVGVIILPTFWATWYPISWRFMMASEMLISRGKMTVSTLRGPLRRSVKPSRASENIQRHVSKEVLKETLKASVPMNLSQRSWASICLTRQPLTTLMQRLGQGPSWGTPWQAAQVRMRLSADVHS